MKVLMICGSMPPAMCGVGDYTATLCNELSTYDSSIHCIPYTTGPWRIRDIFRILKSTRKIHHDLTHIQYPTVGYRKHLGIHLITPFQKNLVVTLHEFRQSHTLRKLSALFFGLFAKAIIFTQEVDLKSYEKWWGWLPARARIIPIGNSVQTSINEAAPRKNKIAYFGLIRKNKGIETFLAAAKQAKDSGIISDFVIIGGVPEGSEAYAQSIYSFCSGIGIATYYNLETSALTELLNSIRYAYLPFPDGASYRRSSLMAALGAKMVVYSTLTSDTEKDISNAFIPVALDGNDFCDVFLRTHSDQALADKLLAAHATILKNTSWPAIANRHCELYQSIFSGS